jgi:hypothetical protein
MRLMVADVTILLHSRHTEYSSSCSHLVANPGDLAFGVACLLTQNYTQHGMSKKAGKSLVPTSVINYLVRLSLSSPERYLTYTMFLLSFFIVNL